MKHILDSGFKYRASHDTDIRKTFERVKRELKAKAEAEAAKPKAPVVASIEPKGRAA